MRSPIIIRLAALAVLLGVASAAHACEMCNRPATVHPGIPVPASAPEIGRAAPALSSRVGAAYTFYLNFDGFAFTGQWGNTGNTPGNTAAYGSEAQIRDIWARTAEKYSAFNVNVTTVDPAVAAGQAGTSLARQTYYENTARTMHTVVGGDGAWFGGGGVSFIGVADNAFGGSAGFKTNWTFPSAVGGTNKNVAEVNAHENGHALGLQHQSDFNVPNGGGTTEYSTNGGASGNGSYAPIMGDSYTAQRGTWRTGTRLLKNQSNVIIGSAIQNDVTTILGVGNPGMTLIDDAIGNSFGAATALPLTGTTVNATLAQGVITPIAGVALGIDNYSKDYFRFTMGQGGLVTLNLANGGDWLTPGVVAGGATLRSKLNIYQSGNLLAPFAVAVEAGNTLSSTFNGFLTAGDYFAEITSFGGHQSTYDATASYFDMGSYVLSGSGILPAVVPEAGTFGMVAVAGLLGLVAKRRKK